LLIKRGLVLIELPVDRGTGFEALHGAGVPPAAARCLDPLAVQLLYLEPPVYDALRDIT
jgi:hypothetical protein